MAGTRRVEYTPLSTIQPALRNPKRHDGAAIAQSISKFGVAELPLVDERTGRLVAGHGRLDQLAAMRREGQAPPEGVQVADSGDWLVPVIRGWASRSDAEAEAYLVASNKLTMRGGWDDEDLSQMLADLAQQELLELTGFTDDGLAELLAGLEPEDVPPALSDPDSVPDAPSEPVSKPGDLWLLGKHRLLCGDSTNPEHLDRALGDLKPGIVYTDPPYGINAVPKDGGVSRGGPFGGVKAAQAKGKSAAMRIPAQKYAPVAGDDTTQVASDAFRLLSAAWPKAAHVWWGGNHYAASAGLPDASCWLVWDKENGASDFADAELAWTNHPGAVRLFKHMWNGMIRATERGKRVHPTQKPVALADWAFSVVDADESRRVVLDVFGGSGSTLIAAHQTGRTAVIVEMEPHYVDIIAKRYQEATGDKPILAATGQPHDFTTGR